MPGSPHAPPCLLSFQPSQHRNPSLYCSYETNDNPYLIFQPAKREIVQLQPYVALYHGFISDDEAEKIKDLAAPWVSSSNKKPTGSSAHIHMVLEERARMAQQWPTSPGSCLVGIFMTWQQEYPCSRGQAQART